MPIVAVCSLSLDAFAAVFESEFLPVHPNSILVTSFFSALFFPQKLRHNYSKSGHFV